MTPPLGGSPVGYEGLRELPLSALLDEFDRLERLLEQRSTPSTPSPDAGRRDFSADALRGRERAVVAEIRRRPGAHTGGPARTSLSGAAPPG
jgi:hypothetical protein